MLLRRIGWSLAAFYLLALAASHVVRHGKDRPIPSGRATLEITSALGDVPSPDTTVLAYRTWPDANDSPPDGQGTPILLLHGSPGSADDFGRLAALLATTRQVLAPDLPGFGASSRRVPDYSIRAHADYVLAFLDGASIDRVHVVGFSMGGGVALHLAHQAPERVQSLTLLSSIGVQELELLGSYHVNHALHGMQLGALWLLHQATPHFGLLDTFPLDVAYARNFLDTDQRPLRAILERLEPPTLILHGEHDPLVPHAAALEHHRLVPQSELISYDDDHFMVFREPDKLAASLNDFFAMVEAGRGVARVHADPQRLARAAEAPVIHGIPARGMALVVLFALLALATMASEDLTCITAGLLVVRGNIEFLPATLACATGIFVGDMILYGCGRLGSRWLHRAPLRYMVSTDALARSRRWFGARGPFVIFASRFIPGMRVPTYVSAGLLRMPVRVYALWLLLPVAVWTPLVVEISRRLGGRLMTLFDRYEQYALLGFVGVLVTVWVTLGVGKRLATYRGRRQIVGWWRRQTRWEFWPAWRLYPPVVFYVLYLGLRHRCLTLFTLANPGLPAGGGFVGESKRAILEAIDPRWVPAFRLVPADLAFENRVATVHQFMAGEGLDYPIVLKPDVGERGYGVVKAQTDDDIERFFRETSADTLVQTYVPGPELGVFYVRMPTERRGRIFAITEKRLPELFGDGTSSIERLILDDPRAVALAKVYLSGLRRALDDVPAAGERVRLVELGTHSLGAIFLDGAGFRTEALEAEIERISQSVDGFFFGRYDIRAPTVEDLRSGRGIQVLELNGVSAEATNIYDPSYSLWDAYRTLFAQWRLAFEIGAQNRARGLEPPSIRHVLSLLRRRVSS